MPKDSTGRRRGRRPGRGSATDNVYSIYLDRDTSAILTEQAEIRGLTRSAVVRALVHSLKRGEATL